MKILIVGASSYVGAKLIRSLKKNTRVLYC